MVSEQIPIHSSLSSALSLTLSLPSEASPPPKKGKIVAIEIELLSVCRWVGLAMLFGQLHISVRFHVRRCTSNLYDFVRELKTVVENNVSFRTFNIKFGKRKSNGRNLLWSLSPMNNRTLEDSFHGEVAFPFTFIFYQCVLLLAF